jgi:hypothetical protein
MVAAVNVGVIVNYPPCGSVTLFGQVQVTSATAFCQGGDSGAGLFDQASPARVAGLIISGNITGTRCHANDVNEVLAWLGLTMNMGDCIETACPGITVSQGSDDPDRSRSRMYALRDGVLGETERGKLWIRTFYDVSAAWVELYAARPDLLAATANSLGANFAVLDAVAGRRPIAIPASQLAALSTLIARHRDAASDPRLRAAFAMWLGDVDDPAVQQAFGVTVVPGGP